MKRQKRDTSHRAFIKGYQAGFNGKNKDSCPHQTNTTCAHQWYEGWREGREDQWQGYKTHTEQQKVVNI